MGVDLLDITFRIEKTFGIRMPFDAWLEVAGTSRDKVTSGFDVTVGELYDFILGRLSETTDGRTVADVHRLVDSPPERFDPDQSVRGLMRTSGRCYRRFLWTVWPSIRITSHRTRG